MFDKYIRNLYNIINNIINNIVYGSYDSLITNYIVHGNW